MANRKNKPGAGRPVEYSREMPVYDTMAACSASTGVPVEALRHAKKNGCVAFRHSRVNFGEFISWWFKQGLKKAEQGDEDDEAIVDWANRDKRGSALIRETKLDIMKKSVILFSSVDSFLRRLTAVIFFGEISRMCKEFPALLKGKSELEISKEMQEQEDLIKNRIHSEIKSFRLKELKQDVEEEED